MAGPKQARGAAASSRATGAGARAKDKGTRGGRPDAQPASPRQGNGKAGAGGPQTRAAGAQARGGGAQGRGGRAGGQLDRAARAGRKPQRAEPEPAAAPDQAPEPGAPLWLRLVTLVLSLGGLGVSVYLTIAHYSTSVVLACPNTGTINCAKVTTSAQSVILGIPVAVLGLAFYAFMVAINSPWAWRAKSPAVGWARLGSVVAGIVFVLYLIYTELFTLDAICLWCTSVHVITFLLFGLIVFSAASLGVKAPARRRPR